MAINKVSFVSVNAPPTPTTLSSGVPINSLKRNPIPFNKNMIGTKRIQALLCKKVV